MAQSLALFVKTIRKMTKALSEVQKVEIARGLPQQQEAAATSSSVKNPTSAIVLAKMAQGGEKGLAKELAEEGDEVVRRLREEQREVIDSLDLKQ